MPSSAPFQVSARSSVRLSPSCPRSRSQNVPAPRELVDDYFSFAEKALKQQKTYAKDLTKALEPISEKFLSSKKAVKAAPKAAATA
jgi:hypothetical protein